MLAEISDKRVVSTIGYNGQVPGPVIRLKEGKPVTVALKNDTDMPEFAHWHGQILPALVDGAPEEKSYVVPPHDELHYRFTPGPAGSRWLHSHVIADSDLHRGTYTGEFAFVYIEPAHEPGDYDTEFFLATHGWEPYFNHEEMAGLAGIKKEEGDEDEEKGPKGWEVGYTALTINGKTLGYGEPRDLNWDYTIFGNQNQVQKPDKVIPMLFAKRNAAKNGFNVWTINGKTYEEQGVPKKLTKGKRYRLAFENHSDDWHPLHLHRNSFELTKVYGKACSGVLKDVVLIKPDGKIEVDFTPSQPGLTLFHCHQQLHMDFGFMKLFDVV